MPTPLSGQPTPAGVAAPEPGRRPLIAALIAFLLAGAAAVAVVRQSEQYHLYEQRTHLSNLAGNYAYTIQSNAERTLSATYALAALVRQGNGSIANFDAIASEMLAYYPGAASLQLAPGGIVQQIVPLAGNEKAIGHNLLQDPTRNKEVFLARDTGRLTLAGPFQLKQGGLGAVGRLPVFLDDSQGKPSFWGFTTVLVRYPQALEGARLEQLTQHGIGYELWRIHPDSGQKQSIAASSAAALIDPVERILTMPNGSWTLSVAPLKGWNDPLWLTAHSVFGLLFSLLLGYLVKLLFELRAHKRQLETLVQRRTSLLTKEITERKCAEVALRDNEKQFKALIDNVPGVIYQCASDSDWTMEFISDYIKGITGYPASDFINNTVRSYASIIYPLDVKLVDSIIQEATREKRPYDIEYRLLDSHDGIKWVHEKGRGIFDGDGKLLHLDGVIFDVTTRKKIEEKNKLLADQNENIGAALRVSEEYLRTIIATTPECVKLVDADGRVIDMNAAGLAMVEADSRDQVIHTPISDLLLPEYHEAFQTLTKSVLQGNKGMLVFELKGLKGTRRWLEMYAVPMTISTGETVLLGISRDITERKRVQDEILRLNATHLALTKNTVIDAGVRVSAFQEICKVTSQALDVARVSIWHYDADLEAIVCEELYEQGADTHSSGLTLLQKDFSNYFAYLREERVLAAHDAHTDAATAEFSAVYLAPLGINSMLDAPVRFEGKLWGVFCIEHIGPQRTWSMEEKTFAASMADFTAHVLSAERSAESEKIIMAERRSLEIELIRSSEDQRRAIGCELHDGLGQHLISLSFLCASLQQQLTNRAQPEANTAQRIGELINEATAMTRSVASGLYPVALEYGLAAALEELVNNARSLQKMDYVLVVAPNVQLHNPLVSINLYRIVQEAMTNALKYSQAALMRIDLARVDGKVRLTLSDDGIGIDPSRLGSAKRLGMHSMYYRASLLGGDMQVQSKAQQGTTITITYPDLERQSEQRK